MFTYKISGKFIAKVPHIAGIDLKNSVDWLMIQRKGNTSHSDTSFVLAFIRYELWLLLHWCPYLLHSHIQTPCRSSQRRPQFNTFKSNISKLIKYSSCSIIILFGSINLIVTPIKDLFYLNQPFLIFVIYFQHFSWLFFHQFLTRQ